MARDIDCVQAQPDRHLLSDFGAEYDFAIVATAATAFIEYETSALEDLGSVFDEPADTEIATRLFVSSREEDDISIQRYSGIDAD